MRRFFAGGAPLESSQVMRVAEAVHANGAATNLRQLRKELRLPQGRLNSVLQHLAGTSILETGAGGEVVWTGGSEATDLAGVAAAAAEAVAADERRRRFESSRVDMMRGYAEVAECRRRYLLNYFGEPSREACGSWDNCRAGVVVEQEGRDEPFPLNSRVRHLRWGVGVVQRYEGDKLTVLFEDVGYKTLALETVLERDLLAPAG
ncbi:hypothetical protein BH20CHL6_BH20CHL6_13650 [soil metagenome]